MDDHPIIREMKSLAGTESDEEYWDKLKADLMQLDPMERSRTLNHIGFLAGSDAVHNGERPTLRQRAELDRHHRELTRLHEAMRKAGR